MEQVLGNVTLWIVFAYLVGAIPTGVVVARLKGVNLQQAGSGNIGATNAGRVLGTKLGILVLVLDALKAATPLWLAMQAAAFGSVDSAESKLAWVGLAAVVGHIFPVYLRFHGGKGVACALGVFVALDPPVALAALVIYGQTIWLSRVSALGSLTAVTSITLSLWIAERSVPYQLLALATAVLIWSRHTDNIVGMRDEARRRRLASQGATPPSPGDPG